MNTLFKQKSAVEVLEILIQGNARFVNGLRSVESFLNTFKMKTLAKNGQKPYCMLITCSDSRIPIELIFDRGLGDLFVVRTFGNLIDPLVIASIEYALTQFNIELVVLMGHARAGAIRLTLENEESPIPLSPHLQRVMNEIKPSLQRARIKHQYFGPLQKSTRNDSMWEKIFQTTYEENLKNSQRKIINQSPIVQERIQAGKLSLVPAHYDLKTGQINLIIPKHLANQLNSKQFRKEIYRHGNTAVEIVENAIESSKIAELEALDDDT